MLSVHLQIARFIVCSGGLIALPKQLERGEQHRRRSEAGGC